MDGLGRPRQLVRLLKDLENCEEGHICFHCRLNGVLALSMRAIDAIDGCRGTRIGSIDMLDDSFIAAKGGQWL